MIRWCFLAFVLLVPCVGSANEQSLSLPWEGVFDLSQAPENVFFRARYRDSAGREHELRVWRQGDNHLLRRTDDRIELHVDKTPGGGYRYRLLDLRRKILIRADRKNLYRIGVFSDWNGLAHVLSRPHGAFSLAVVQAETQSTTTGLCQWYHLSPAEGGNKSRDVCWSDAWGLPLMIRQAGKDAEKAEFSVREVDTFVPTIDQFKVDKRDFVEIDANADIDPSSD